ncbi:hypothetical protein [Legionella feeleii]|uniref:Uncharacterized protein n=1 Tax=Legionella feeleii TaxID=453 RepID=A0A378IY72_9GAMM|nr:hypothetical protein [Legionella feeleii]STX39852.1 Uncharacterised protein [Legionella feeleii]
MKKIEKALVLLVFTAGLICLFLSLIVLSIKLLESSAVLFDIAGLLQLELAGFFDHLFKELCDEEKFPYGPPSSITREILGTPEIQPLISLRALFFYNKKLGLSLLLFSSLIQFLSIWM